MTLLQVSNISKRFGGLTALCDVSFDVFPRQIVGLIGPNGAGKSTLFNCLSGIEHVSEGHIRFKEADITNSAVDQIVKNGLTRTFQTTRIFRNLSVLENVMVGCHIHMRSNFLFDMIKLPWAVEEDKVSKKNAFKCLELVSLEDLAETPAVRLTLSQARRMEIARVLATKPELLLLDEPSAGMDEKEREDLKELLLDLNRQGITLMVIEHDLELVVDICKDMDIMVLDYGRLLARGTPEAIQRNEQVLEAYLGGKDDL